MASTALGGPPGGHWDNPFLIDDQEGAGSYGSEVIAFLIGPSEVLFRIHEQPLETKTCFFTYHPDAGRMVHGSDQEDAPPARNSEPIPYPLRDVQTGTFRIFEELLYEKPIGVPASPAVLRKFLDTYLLATRYKAFSLLDRIMDGVRQYPLGKVVKFEFLTYALDRHTIHLNQQPPQVVGGAPRPLGLPQNCKIIIYLIDKIIWDIVDQGLEIWKRDNPGFDGVFVQNAEGIQTSLFSALARLGTDGKGPDPATPEGVKQTYYVGMRQAAVAPAPEPEGNQQAAGRPTRRRRRE